MKVYKYVDATTLFRIIDDHRIGFTHPRDFNDPFDRPRISPALIPFGFTSMLDNEEMTIERQARESEEAWGQYAVSSFTRTYDNMLMWAHYANKHKGACIEFDAELANLTSMSLLIPVQFGSVIYMKRPNPDAVINRGRGPFQKLLPQAGENRFNIDNYERLQRLFLTKPLPWAYEEEIRAVGSPLDFWWGDGDETVDGSWTRYTKLDKTTGYGWKIKPGAITKVFTGLRRGHLDRLRELASVHKFEIVNACESSASGYEVDFQCDDPTILPTSPG